MHENEVKELGANIFRFKTLRECKSIHVYKNQWRSFWREHLNEYEIIHIHYMSHAGLIAQVAKQYGIVTIVHSHITGYERWGQHLIEKYVTRRNLSLYTDYQFACAKEAGQFFFGEKFDQEGIVLRNAIELSDFEFSPAKRKKQREKYKLEDKLVIGHVGNYVLHKNQDFMLKVFAEVAKKEHEAVLVWAGNISDKNLPHVKEVIKNENIQHQVRLLGRCENIAEWMQAFDIFLFPSLFEGLGIVLIEAQTGGLKCIVSDTIPEEAIVTDLVTCCKLKESPAQWAQVILDNYRYERKSRKEIVATAGYDIQKAAVYMENFYRSIVKSAS